MQDISLPTIAELMEIAGKASYIALRQLHAKTASNAILAAMNGLFFREEEQDATISADCIQAARAILAEYCHNYHYEPYQTIGYKRTGRAITPFALACEAVKKVIAESASLGMTGRRSEVAQVAARRIDLAPEDVDKFGGYVDHAKYGSLTEIFKGKFVKMLVLMRDGYEMKEIAERLNISLPRAYHMRQKIRDTLLETGEYNQYK